MNIKKLPLLYIFFFIINNSFSQNLNYSTPYTFTTIASQILNGNGYQDGIGNIACFNQPSGIAIDNSGNLYIADTNNYVVRKISPSGIVSTIAGQVGVKGNKDGNGLSAQFGLIYGITIDSLNNIYVTDTSYNTVKKITYTNGNWVVSTIISTSSGLNNPTGIAADLYNNLYISDSGNNVIRKLDSSNNLSIYAGNIGVVGAANGNATNASFAYPTGLTLDQSGNLYVSDSSANMIRKITKAGIVSTVAGSYGAPGQVDGLLTSGLVSLSHPNAIICDATGNLIFSDGNNGSVLRMISSQGVTSTLGGTNSPGGSDGVGQSASFSNINGLTLDNNGSLYIVNAGTATIRKGTPPLINTAPTITNTTSDTLAAIGGTYTLTANANGSSPFNFVWYFNGTPLSNTTPSNTANSSTITITNFSSNQAGQYYVIASNNYGYSKSPIINLDLPIVLLNSPQSISTTSGNSITFSAQASGTTPSYQWYFNNNAINGANSSTYTIQNTNASNIGTYYVVISNPINSIKSNSVSLSFINPVILTQPVSTTGAIGSNVSLSVNTTGNSNIYQWYYNGNAINGANSSVLNLTNLSTGNLGTYYAIVSNTYGSATTNSVTVSLPSSASRLVNLSVLSTVGQGSQMLTLGFVNSGNGTNIAEPLLIRAIGPTLTNFSVTNTLSDPSLTIYQGSNIVGSNDNWGSSNTNITSVNNADIATGAFNLPNINSLDAAIVQNLASTSGGYTVQISGNNGTTGIALAEIYDYTQNYSSDSPRLINLSCLQKIDPSGTLTAGFVIKGSSPLKVLIRASGPALSTFGVTGYLPDPQINVFDSSTTIVGSNAGWAGNNTITSAALAVGAFTYTNQTSLDSAVVLSLPPGSYTAEAKSSSGLPGKVLIEVYEVP